MAIKALPKAGQAWDAPIPVGDFSWQFNGCPHVGGSIAFDPEGRMAHAVVWTGAPDAAGAYYLRSDTGIAAWSTPTRLRGDANAWRADIAAGSDDRVAAVWDAAGKTGSTGVFAGLSTDGGQTWAAPQRLSATDVNANHPRVVPINGGFLAVWTERAPHNPTRWRARRLCSFESPAQPSRSTCGNSSAWTRP